MTKRSLGDRGLDLIRQYEGCRLEAYNDSRGICTIGYGHIKTARPNMVISQERAEQLLALDLADAENDVHDLVDVPLTGSMFDALVSWTFNLGGRRLSESTMLLRLNDERYLEVPREMIRWYKTPGSELGLLRRRLSEAVLFIEDGLP
jgi:lysozyme